MRAHESASPRAYGRGPSRLDPIAPDWLVRILAPKKAPVPWLDMIRVCLTVTAPLAVAVAAGHPGLGVLAGMGSLVGVFGDKGGTFGARLRRTGAGTAAAFTGLIVERLVEGHGALEVLSIAVLAVVSALLSSISANLSFAGLQLLVYVTIAGAFPPNTTVPVVLGTVAVGIGWALVLSGAQARVEGPPAGPRSVEVGVLRDLALALRGENPAQADVDADAGDDGAGPSSVGWKQRRRITRRVARAYDDLVTARSSSPGSRRDLRRLAAALTSTFELIGACFDYLGSGGAHGSEVAPLLEDLAGLAAGDDPKATQRSLPALQERIRAAGTRRHELRVVTASLEQVTRTLAERRPRPVAGPREPAGAWLFGAKTWTFAARLAITLAVAETLRLLVPVGKPYWIVLTAAIVLKPDLGSVFARGVQRTLGTLAGVMLGVAIVALVPPGGWLLVPVAVLAFCFPFGASRNYGLLSTLITPLVLLLLDFNATAGTRLALDRLIDTGIGAAVVLVVGYLCWPSTWRPRLGEHIAAGVETLGSYARVAFGTDNHAAGLHRRRSYRAVSDIRAELQSALAEPPPLSSRAAAWWPLIVQLEKTADDLSDASLLARHHGQRPPPHDVAQLVAGFDDLAAALRGHRAPRRLRDPATSLLADLAGDLRGARRVASGPLTD